MCHPRFAAIVMGVAMMILISFTFMLSARTITKDQSIFPLAAENVCLLLLPDLQPVTAAQVTLAVAYQIRDASKLAVSSF